MKKISILLITSVLLLLPNFFNLHLSPLQNKGHSWEEFDLELVSEVQTITQLLAKADSIEEAQQLAGSKRGYTEIIDGILKKRFYTGYSHYGLHNNWMAAILGKIFREDLSAIVLPDDILKYPMAACSQQSIVFMEALKHKNIDYRKIGFDHHYALEAKTENGWLFFDSHMEPEFNSKVTRTSIDSIFQKGILHNIYRNRLDSVEINWGLANPYYGDINAAPAPNAALMHRITKIFSKFSFLFPLSLIAIIIYQKKTKNNTRIIQQEIVS